MMRAKGEGPDNGVQRTPQTASPTSFAQGDALARNLSPRPLTRLVGQEGAGPGRSRGTSR